VSEFPFCVSPFKIQIGMIMKNLLKKGIALAMLIGLGAAPAMANPQPAPAKIDYSSGAYSGVNGAVGGWVNNSGAFAGASNTVFATVAPNGANTTSISTGAASKYGFASGIFGAGGNISVTSQAPRR
jgi:hypothetical protein